MSVQDGLLSFQMKETIFLSSDKPEIEELRELELLPDLEIRENDYEITICGSLQLRGKYVPTKNANAKADGGTDTLVSAMKFTPLQLEQGDTEVFFADEEADIMHRIPLSISVPISRTKEVSDIHGIVDSFDYEIKGPKQLLITADLKIAGIQLKNEQEIRAEQQSHKSADTWEYIQVAQDESAEHEYQHVTIDDLERKLTALEKEVEAQLEQQNDEGQELIDEVADTEQYQPYPLYQPFPGFEMQQGDVAQSSWDQDSATRFRYQHPQYAAYEAEAEEEAEREEIEEIEEIEQSSNVPYQTYSNIQEESMGQQSPYEYGFHPISMPEPPQYAPPYGTQPFYPINSFGQGPGHGFGVEPNPIPFAPPPPNPFQPIAGQFHHQQPPQYPFAQMPPYAPPQQMFYQHPPNPVPEPVSAMQYQPEYMDKSPYQATYQPPPSNEYVEESVEDQEVRTDGVYAEPVSYHEPVEVEDDDEAALEEVHESPYEATFKEESSHIEQSEPFTLISEHQEEATEPKEAVVKHQEVVTEPKEAVIKHQEVVTEPKEAVIKHQEVVAEPKEVAVKHQEEATEPKEAVVKHQEVVTEPKEAVIKHQEVVAEPKEAVVKHQDVVAEPKEVAVKHQEVVAEPKEAVVKHQEVVTEPKEVAVKHQEVVTELKEVAVKHQEVVAEPKEAVVKHQEVVTEPKEVAVKHQEIVTEPKEAAIKHQEEATEPKEAAIKHQEVATEPKEVAVKHQEVVTEPKEAVVKQQEMATEPKEVVTEQREEWIANPHSRSKVQLSADPDPYAKYWEGSEDDQEDVTKTAKKEATTERTTEASKVHVDLDENRVHAHTAEYDQELQAPAISTELSTEEEASVLMAQLEAEEEKSVEEIVASPVVEQEKEMKVAIGSKNNHKEQNEMMNFSNIFSHLHGNEKNKNQRVESKQEEALEQTKAKRDGSSSRRDALGNLTSFVQDRTEKFSKLKMCIIQKNDTLDSIAQRYDLSVTKIKEANRMSTDRVEEGQILYIPQ
ncbi:LysM peptidoglycan-binding domain-containing protein [Brevibacillus laterosporus]|uniref:LysM peptidoglycan-binding domain-containing protein n=1 Tax=Brevibacillus laterosporus TaxID=1465 RepID=UPI003D20844A